jgi:hypothetical protein
VWQISFCSGEASARLWRGRSALLAPLQAIENMCVTFAGACALATASTTRNSRPQRARNIHFGQRARDKKTYRSEEAFCFDS